MIHQFKQYKSDLTTLIENLSLYEALTFRQVCRLLPDIKEETLTSLLKKLTKEGRLFFNVIEEIIYIDTNTSVNERMIAAFWVLLDFMPKVTFHTSSDYPIILTFFAKDEVYEVFYADEGNELLLNRAISSLPSIDKPHRLIIIANEKQITGFTVPGITAFCRIDENGNIKYYKKQGVDRNVNR